jgi:DNA-binding NtrC family response regulator
MSGAPKSGRILVVDDEPSVLMTYRLILEQQGYKVTAAVSAADARKVLGGDKIELLLCDLSLEKQESGFDVIDFGRKNDPELLSVLLTGYATQDAAEWAEQHGIPILFKPIDIQQLLETIESLLRKRHEIGQAFGD